MRQSSPGWLPFTFPFPVIFSSAYPCLPPRASRRASAPTSRWIPLYLDKLTPLPLVQLILRPSYQTAAGDHVDAPAASRSKRLDLQGINRLGLACAKKGLQYLLPDPNNELLISKDETSALLLLPPVFAMTGLTCLGRPCLRVAYRQGRSYHHALVVVSGEQIKPPSRDPPPLYRSGVVRRSSPPHPRIACECVLRQQQSQGFCRNNRQGLCSDDAYVSVKCLQCSMRAVLPSLYGVYCLCPDFVAVTPRPLMLAGSAYWCTCRLGHRVACFGICS